MVYTYRVVIEIRKTEAFQQWYDGLRDQRAQARVDVRIRRLELGLAGDVKAVGDGVFELRIDYGPGYRVYFVRRGKALIVLLGGGDKRTQVADIRAAKVLAPLV
jgi:putative addiction module killer protein